MKTILYVLLKSLESMTLDVIPFYYNRYYVMNLDNSGYFMPAKYNIVNKEVVYYPLHGEDALESRDEYTAGRYRAGLLNALVGNLLALATVVIFNPDTVLGTTLLYVIVLSVGGLVISVLEAIITAVNMHKTSEVGVLNVEGGLGQYSDTSDKQRSIPMKKLLDPHEKRAADQEAENSRLIRERIVRS